MRLFAPAFLFTALTALSNSVPLDFDSLGYHDSKTAASVARTLVHRESLSNLATVEKSTNYPVSFVEYYSDCDNDGQPIMLMIDMSSSSKNILDGSFVSLSIRVGDHQLKDHVNPHYIGGRPNSVAGSPRVNLKGKFKSINGTTEVGKCFAKRHPESTFWFPGSPVHSSHWVKFEVEEVYFIGGFGDRAYIGQIPVKEYLAAEIMDDGSEEDEGEERHSRYHSKKYRGQEESEEDSLFGKVMKTFKSFFYNERMEEDLGSSKSDYHRGTYDKKYPKPFLEAHQGVKFNHHKNLCDEKRSQKFLDAHKDSKFNHNKGSTNKKHSQKFLDANKDVEFDHHKGFQYKKHSQQFLKAHKNVKLDHQMKMNHPGFDIYNTVNLFEETKEDQTHQEIINQGKR